MAPTPQAALDIAAKAGYKYIEVPLTTWKINPETATKKDINAIKDMLKSGVEARSLGMIWPSEYMMVTTSAAELKRNLNYTRKLFDLSSALDIKIMNLGSGPNRSVPPNMPYIEGLKILANFWKEACKHAEDLDVIVGIEHNPRARTNVGDTTKQIIDLVKAIDSPSFQMNAQVHDMAYADIDVPAAIRAAGDIIKLVHISDVAGFNQIVDPTIFPVPGKGKFDFISIFRAFKDIGYDGEFCIEPTMKPEGDYIKEIREGRKVLEEKWKQA